MGNSILKNSLAAALRLCSVTFLLVSFCFGQAEKKVSESSNLGDLFGIKGTDPTVQNTVDEVEPIVVGRKKWSDRASSTALPISSTALPISSNNDRDQKNVRNSAIEELDPLETKQGNSNPSIMPLKPPSIPPAVNLHRNFEGKLVLKPRKLGIEREFPFQLENAKGKRLAFIDTESLLSVDPLSFKDKKVNILGKLEPVKEGSDDLVIRARILRVIE
jgi:hypothetical protein